MFKVDQIDHVEFFVPDRREAARWYERTLGLLPVAAHGDWGEDPGGPLMISSNGGGSWGTVAVTRAQNCPKTSTLGSQPHRPVRFRTPTGMSCSALQAIVQAWQPMHFRRSMANP